MTEHISSEEDYRAEERGTPVRLDQGLENEDE